MEMKPLDDAVKVIMNNITDFNEFLAAYKELSQKILKAEISTPYHIQHACKIIGKKQEELQLKQLPLRFLATFEELSKINSNITSQVMNVLEDAVKVAAKNIADINEFLTAYRNLLPIHSDYVTLVKKALEDAVKVAAGNIAGFDESTNVLIACDVSGSMQKAVSPKSKIMNYDIGLMLGMLLKSRCKNAVSGIFGSTWKIVELPDGGVLSNVDAFYKREGEVGYSTNGHLVIEDLINSEKVMDKIMIFTDCQLWDSTGSGTRMKDVWQKYKSMAPKAKLYLFDLAGYGQVPLNITNEDVHLIAGWSDKIFDILQAIDNGSDALKEIKAMEI